MTTTASEFAYKMFIIDLQQGLYEENPTVQEWNDLLPEKQQSYMKEAEVYMELPKNNESISNTIIKKRMCTIPDECQTSEDLDQDNKLILQKLLDKTIALSTSCSQHYKRKRFFTFLVRVVVGILLSTSALSINSRETRDADAKVGNVPNLPPKGPNTDMILPVDGLPLPQAQKETTAPALVPALIPVLVPAPSLPILVPKPIPVPASATITLNGRSLRLNLEFDDQVSAQQAIVTIYHSVDGSPFKEFIRTQPGVMIIPIRIEELGKKHCFYGVVSLGPDSSSASEPFCEIIRPVPKIKKFSLTSE